MRRTREAQAGARACAAAALALVGAGCGGDVAGGEGGRLVLTGSSTVAPLAVEVARPFEAARPGVRVEVQTGGSSRGVADVRSGVADLGMASRAPLPGEEDLAWHAVALDGVAPIVHASSPVTAITTEALADVYAGRLRSWRELGGPDAPVTVVAKASGRATLAVFLEHTGLAERDVRADVVIGDNGQGIATVAASPRAIAYVSLGAALAAAEEGAPVRPLALDGVPPTLASVREGAWPLVRPLHLVSRDAPSGLAAELVAFWRSEAHDDLVRGLGLVPAAP